MMKTTKVAGFTLIELMIAVAIVAIIASIAYPSYVDYVNQSRRADATTTLMNLQMAQERYRANNPNYASLAELGWANTSAEGFYTLAVIDVSATSYTATASATGAQAGDTACATISLDQDGPVTTTAAQRNCWNR